MKLQTDFVYFESQQNHPFLIRRIEELIKTPGGNVEAKVACYYRKRDISSSLLSLSEKHAKDLEEEMGIEISEHERHLLNHKELFLSRQIDTLPATHIRGKCNVTLLNETEDLKSYLSKQDSFFYTLVYDPTQKTLVADRGEIRVGSKFQAEVPDKLITKTVAEEYERKNYESLMWLPNKLADDKMDTFIFVAKSVGTLARAVDNTGSLQPSLHVNAACANRDSTLAQAYDVMHKCDYDFAEATQAIANPNNPMLARDELEHWAPGESHIFTDAIDKFGKAFHEMHQEYFHWKTLPAIVEYYYMYKTSDRYVQNRRAKAAEAENKLKQVYIPPYKASTHQLKQINGDHGTKPCEGCNCTSSYQWYNWGPLQVGSRLCASCWNYWKKCGGLKLAQASSGRRETCVPYHNKPNGDGKMRGDDVDYDAAMMMGDAAHRISPKTKQAFFLNATSLTRISRRLCTDLLKPRRHSRKPFLQIPVAAIKAECQMRLSNRPAPVVNFTKKSWISVNKVLEKLSGRPITASTLPREARSRGTTSNNNNHKHSLKRPLTTNGGSNGGVVGGGASVARNLAGPPRKRRNVNFPEMSEDYLFKSTDTIRAIRRQISATSQRSMARRPNKQQSHNDQPAAQALLAAAATNITTTMKNLHPNNNNNVIQQNNSMRMQQEPIVIDD